MQQGKCMIRTNNAIWYACRSEMQQRMHATAKDRDLYAIQENYGVYVQSRAGCECMQHLDLHAVQKICGTYLQCKTDMQAGKQLKSGPTCN